MYYRDPTEIIYNAYMITFDFSENDNIFNLGATGDMALPGEC